MMAVNRIGNMYFLVAGLWLMLCSFSMLSCRSDDNSSNADGITGEWKLIEVLVDPGDGSGRFTPVESQKRISIHEDDTFSSNGAICDLSITTGEPTQGNVLEDDQGYYLACEEPLTGNVRLSIVNGNLIATFFCIEPCQHKYQRTD